MDEKYKLDMVLAVLCVVTAWGRWYTKSTGVEVPWLLLAEGVIEKLEADND